MAIVNLFGDLANDLSIKNIIKTLGRFSFDSSSQLRVLLGGGNITTVATSNGSIGDSGKTSTIMQNSSIMFNSSVRRNFA